MSKLVYVTTNQEKVKEANCFFVETYGFEIEIVNPVFEVLEIQAKTSGEVAAFSAQYAAKELGIGCLKSDTGLYIECLGGLPGPYNAYFDKQIGVEKFLELLKDQKNRRARLEHAFAFCEPNGKPFVFSSGGTGNIAYAPAGNKGRWHDFFYIPEGETETLSQLRERNAHYEKQFWGTAIDEFAVWYKKHIESK